jgi:hypothetical protein
MPAEQSTGRQEEPLTGRIFGGVGGLHENVHGLEVLPHWMRRVCTAAVKESVRRQEVAEFVVNGRCWHAINQGLYRATGDRCHADEHHPDAVLAANCHTIGL